MKDISNKDTLWSVNNSLSLYNIQNWSDAYLDINHTGHLLIKPNRTQHEINLHELTKQLEAEGLKLPILIRFSDILKDRVNTLINAFDSTMHSKNINSNYTAVYPIKVNQQRKVIEDIIEAGKQRVGLEAGSKPELLICIALASSGSTIICNGYKDREYIRIALISSQLGFNTYIVIEKLSELKLIIECTKELDITPNLGLRVRLSSIGKGNWQNTGGEKSKFGLRSHQILKALEILENNNLVDSLKLLHFHIGSQVTDLDDIKSGLNEGVRYYAQLKKLSVPIDTIDIGGGLGIDYEGTESTHFCSINYSVKSYAEMVVKTVHSICIEEKQNVPSIITESGRAMTAHHAMLITNIIDVENSCITIPDNKHDADHPLMRKLSTLLNNFSEENLLEIKKQNEECFDEAKELFSSGQIDLKQFSIIERLYFSNCNNLLVQSDEKQAGPISDLRHRLADKYFCNFSLFQTMPDSWAIDQVFPIVPLQRLNEKPQRRCTIHDLTCDSDGRINLYVVDDGIEASLPIHPIQDDEDYLIGIFLLGAYQEILGDIHNLFGDSASVNIQIDKNNNMKLSEIDFGDKVSDLFQSIHIDKEKLKSRYKSLVGQSDYSENDKNIFLQHLFDGIDGYTYLEEK